MGISVQNFWREQKRRPGVRREGSMKNFMLLCFLAALTARVFAAEIEALPGTQPLRIDGDLASQMVDGIDRFLLSELEKSVAGRAAHWTRDFSSADAYYKSIEPNRKRLAHILGVVDAR